MIDPEGQHVCMLEHGTCACDGYDVVIDAEGQLRWGSWILDPKEDGVIRRTAIVASRWHHNTRPNEDCRACEIMDMVNRSLRADRQAYPSPPHLHLLALTRVTRSLWLGPFSLSEGELNPMVL